MSVGSQIWLDSYVGLISIIIPIIATYVITFLKAKVGNENLKKYLTLAEMAVRGAEQIHNENGKGTEKKEAVEEYLSKKIGNKLTPKEIDYIIESTVHAITQSIKK